jgi:hypothetical protein
MKGRLGAQISPLRPFRYVRLISLLRKNRLAGPLANGIAQGK